MPRRALLLSLALAGVLGCTDASAARTTFAVRGDVTAIAFAGDALIVARQRTDGSLRLERWSPGAPAQTLLRLPRSGEDTTVSLAASAQALALGLQPDGGEDSDPSHVFVGPSAGPLREVAACKAGLLRPAVAVSGSRIAWPSGGCGEPVSHPSAFSPVAIVIGGADPAAPLRRIAVGPDALPMAIMLNGETGLVGLLRPSFFHPFNSEVRRLGVSVLGETVARENGGTVAPIGVLPNGDTVFGRGGFEDDEDAEAERGPCDSSLFVLAPGSSQRRTLSLGDCPIDESFQRSEGGARVAGERVYAIVAEDVKRQEATRPRPVALKTVRSDGRDVLVLARGTYRPPRGLATDAAGRVAWWQRGCTGGSEIVTDDGAGPRSSTAIPACRVKVLNRSARVRGGRIMLRLQCPQGCSGEARVRTRRGTRLVRSFSFKPGTHRLSLRLTRRERRGKRLALSLQVAAGPSRAAVIRLR